MIHFVFSDKDPRYLFLKYDTPADLIQLHKLRDHMNLIDPVCFMPQFEGIPFTQDFLFEYTQQTGQKIFYCSIGLWQEVYKFFRDNNIEYDGLDAKYFKRNMKHTFEEFKNIVDSWNLAFSPHPYQYEAAYKILQWNKSVSQLATRAGKTLISYMVFRYAMEYLGVKRILMIVPSIDLVKQAYNDFKEYAEFFKTECIWGGGKLVESSNLSVGTYQSLIQFITPKSKKYRPTFFDTYDLVFVDETHKAKANEIKRLISQPFMLNVKIAFGMTGTLPPEKTVDHYCIHALLGAKIQEITPKALMDGGYISKINITQHRIEHKNTDDLYIKCAEYWLSDYITERNAKGKKERIKLENPKFLIQYIKELPPVIKEVKYKYKDDKAKYIESLHKFVGMSKVANALLVEKTMIHFLDKRIDYLCYQILPNCPRNTLILAHHTEYINYFAKIIKERFPDRHIDIITGSVSSKKRDEIKQMLKDNNDCILIASYGVLSTGITLSNLCYGVLFESFKSNIVNMQSLGRGLGLSDLKEEYVVHDIIDVLPTKKIYLQGTAKIKIYKKNYYPYSIINKEMDEHIYERNMYI